MVALELCEALLSEFFHSDPKSLALSLPHGPTPPPGHMDSQNDLQVGSLHASCIDVKLLWLSLNYFAERWSPKQCGTGHKTGAEARGNK